jgi:hypothetical protein
MCITPCASGLVGRAYMHALRPCPKATPRQSSCRLQTITDSLGLHREAACKDAWRQCARSSMRCDASNHACLQCHAQAPAWLLQACSSSTALQPCTLTIHVDVVLLCSCHAAPGMWHAQEAELPTSWPTYQAALPHSRHAAAKRTSSSFQPARSPVSSSATPLANLVAARGKAGGEPCHGGAGTCDSAAQQLS